MTRDTLELASLGVTILVLALQAWNLYITASLKLWVYQTFVPKSDLKEVMRMLNHQDHQ